MLEVVHPEGAKPVLELRSEKPEADARTTTEPFRPLRTGCQIYSPPKAPFTDALLSRALKSTDGCGPHMTQHLYKMQK